MAQFEIYAPPVNQLDISLAEVAADKEKKASKLWKAAAVSLCLTSVLAAYAGMRISHRVHNQNEKITMKHAVNVAEDNNGIMMSVAGVAAGALMTIGFFVPALRASAQSRLMRPAKTKTQTPPVDVPVIAPYSLDDVLGDVPAIGVKGPRPSSATPSGKNIAAPKREYRFPSQTSSIDPV